MDNEILEEIKARCEVASEIINGSVHKECDYNSVFCPLIDSNYDIPALLDEIGSLREAMSSINRAMAEISIERDRLKAELERKEKSQ